MEVVRSEPETAPGADPVFTVGEMTESGVLFKGTHVSEVLAGALNGGLPIEGFEGIAWICRTSSWTAAS